MQLCKKVCKLSRICTGYSHLPATGFAAVFEPNADETKGFVKGGGRFVWVFTNMTTVAHVFAITTACPGTTITRSMPLRAFTRLRIVINTSTPKGTHEFATLLSIQQTLRYRGMSPLEFMRSGRMEIEG